MKSIFTGVAHGRRCVQIVLPVAFLLRTTLFHAPLSVGYSSRREPFLKRLPGFETFVRDLIGILRNYKRSLT